MLGPSQSLYGFVQSSYYNVAKLALLEKGLAFEEVGVALGEGGKLVATAKPNERTQVMERMRWNRDKFYEKWVLSTVRGLKNDEKIWLSLQEVRIKTIDNGLCDDIKWLKANAQKTDETMNDMMIALAKAGLIDRRG